MPPILRTFTGSDMPDEEISQQCVRCGLCLPHCPTYLETLHETSSPRGRIQLIRAVAQGKLDLLSPGFVAQMGQCLDCRACEAACPSGVAYGQLVESARAQIQREQAKTENPWQRRQRALLLDGLFGDMHRFRQAASTLRLYQRSGGQKVARLSGILKLLNLTDTESLLPDLPDHWYVPSNQHYQPTQVTTRPTVAFFAGCVMSTIFAPTDRATVRVLTAFGFPVVTPANQGCCGAITIHAGEPDRARALAKQNIVAFEEAGAEVIVNNAAGCGSALKEYGQLFADDEEWHDRAVAFSDKVRDISELLATALDDTTQALLQPLELHITFQDACHLAHAQRITRQPRDLLLAIPSLRFTEMAESALCCGSAGVYNITQPDMARRLQQRKVQHAVATQAEIIVTANPGCFLQLRAGVAQSSRRPGILHIIDIIDASLRGLSRERVMAMSRRGVR